MTQQPFQTQQVIDRKMDRTVRTLLVLCSMIGSMLADDIPEEERIKAAIEVTSPPRITREPTAEIPFKKDEEVELYCIASGDPAPSYRWLVNGEPLEIDGNVIKQVAAQGTIRIENPSPDHEGMYQCLAENEYGTALSIKSLLKYARLDTFVSRDVVVHRPIVGEYLKLKCDPPDSYPAGSIYWGEGNSDEKINSIENNDRVILDYEGHLHFAHIESKDALHDMSYVCVVYNHVLRGLVQGDDQKIIPITRTTPNYKELQLRWHSETPRVVIEGQTLKMKCIFSGYPTPQVTWEREGAELPATHKINDYGLELEIPSVEFEDSGRYVCVAQNSMRRNPARKTLEVRVEAKPKWIKKPDSVDTSEGETAEFRCQVAGAPKPDITWTRNGDDLESIPNQRRTIYENGERVVYTGVAAEDAAVLQCNASNKHGYIFTNAYLNVLSEPPTWITHPQTVVKVAEGQTATLACEVYGAPKPVVTWSKEGEVVEGNRFTIDNQGKIAGNLTIEVAILSDSGIYTCQAINKFGNITGSGELVVRNKTEIIKPPASQDVIAGEDVVLTCDATTDEAERSKLTITWKKNDVPIDFEREATLSFDTVDNSLRITGANVMDTGRFTCVASNGLDSDEFTADIVVKDRPSPPWDIAVVACGAQTAKVKWDMWPAAANNDPITEFIVYYNTSYDEADVFHEGAVVDAGKVTATIRLTPFANFTFHVKAKNSLGVSDPSPFSTVCNTPSMEPYRNPEDVCTNSEQPDELVITWKKMPQVEHHGEDFRYIVSYKRRGDPDADPVQKTIDNWQEEELIVPNQPTFQEYEISVQAVNREGPSPDRRLEVRLGYSGEDRPTVSPVGFEVLGDTLTDKSATFQWDPVDESPEAIRGHFKGYRIIYWKVDDPENRRQTDVILKPFDPCPVLEPAATGRKRRQAENKVTGHVEDLWPFSTIKAGILVLNGAKLGALSDTIEFKTPEGLPGRVQNAKVIQRGSYHLQLEWLPPLEPNGIITGYSVGYKDVFETTRQPKFEPMLPPTTRITKLKKLEPETDYIITVYAHTSKGRGEDHAFLEASTLSVMPPDKPEMHEIVFHGDYAEVSWDETEEGKDSKNPGSEFYVKYRKKGNDTWLTLEPEDENDNWVNITGLKNGEAYEIFVVAVSGYGDSRNETASDIETFPIIVTPTEEEETTIVQDAVEGPVVQKIASAGWFISLMCLLILLLVVIIIVCLIRRNRGGKYPVHEKEKLRGRPDDPEDRMGEYNKQPYMPLETKSDEPNYLNEKPPLGGSMDKEDQPLAGSESDSMAEYEDTDPTKFNEDGSFIGAYAGDNAYKKNDTTPLSTFV